MTINGSAAAKLVAEVNVLTGCALELDGVAEQGDSGGAAYVRWPGGRPGVLTHTHVSVERMQVTAEVLALARRHDVPVPRHDLAVELADGTVAVVQERLPGDPAGRVDVATIEALVALNERFAGLLVNRSDIPAYQFHLRQSGPDFPRHELLERYSERTRRILRRIREIGGSGPDELAGVDLVHPDFARGNILFDHQGQITGVVDWNSGVIRGDRRFALVCLRSDLEWRKLSANPDDIADQTAVDLLDNILATTIEPTLLLRYWARSTLGRLHWTILGNSPDVTEIFLRLGQSRLS